MAPEEYAGTRGGPAELAHRKLSLALDAADLRLVGPNNVCWSVIPSTLTTTASLSQSNKLEREISSLSQLYHASRLQLPTCLGSLRKTSFPACVTVKTRKSAAPSGKSRVSVTKSVNLTIPLHWRRRPSSSMSTDGMARKSTETPRGCKIGGGPDSMVRTPHFERAATPTWTSESSCGTPILEAFRNPTIPAVVFVGMTNRRSGVESCCPALLWASMSHW